MSAAPQRRRTAVPGGGVDHALAGLRRLRVAAPPPAVWIAAALLLLTTMFWATLTPGTRAPDELQHLNSVVRLANGGGWPQPGDARVSREVFAIMELAGATYEGSPTALQRTVLESRGMLFADVTPTGVDDRSSLAQLRSGPEPPAVMDQMTQHPPGYYAVTAVVFDVVGAENWRYDRAVYFLRFLTGLAIAATVPLCLYLVTRDLSGREWTAQATAFLPLLIPQLGFIGGSVTNDGMTMGAASVLVAVLVRLMTAGPTTRRLLAVALAAAAVCWTKGTALTLLPLVPISLALAYRRAARGGGLYAWLRPLLLNGAWVAGLAFVLGGWWWTVNIFRYGTVQPAAYETPVADAPVVGFAEFYEGFQRRVSTSFFGQVGLNESPLSLGLTQTLTIVLLLLVAMGLWSRRRLAERALFVAGTALTFGVMLVTTYSLHQASHTFPGQQGRYLFVLLVPLLALVAAGLDRLRRLLRLPERALLVVVPAVGAAVAATGLVLGFEVYFLPEGRSVGAALDTFLGWSPWSWSVLAALGAGSITCGLVLAFVLGRTATSPDGPRRPSDARSGAGPGDGHLSARNDGRGREDLATASALPGADGGAVDRRSDRPAQG